MDAVHVLGSRLRITHLVFVGQPLVAVAGGAGLRQVQLEDRRTMVFDRQNVVRTMTISATCGAGSAQGMAHPVNACLIHLGLIGMAIGTLRRRKRSLVNEFRDRRVAVDTVEAAVNGGLECFRNQRGQRDGATLDGAGQGRILVAFQAIGVAEWLVGFRNRIIAGGSDGDSKN